MVDRYACGDCGREIIHADSSCICHRKHEMKKLKPVSWVQWVVADEDGNITCNELRPGEPDFWDTHKCASHLAREMTKESREDENQKKYRAIRVTVTVDGGK